MRDRARFQLSASTRPEMATFRVTFRGIWSLDLLHGTKDAREPSACPENYEKAPLSLIEKHPLPKFLPRASNLNISFDGRLAP